MALAADLITIELGGESISLRPSLRCALRSERWEGSFGKLIDDLTSGSLSASLFVLRDHHDHPFVHSHILDAGLDKVGAQLVEYVIQCMGIDPEAKAEGPSGEAITFAEHLRHLYRIGTGWLGWTPDTTLDSTPDEIREAFRGRVEMLRAIFGGSEDKPADLTSKFKAAFGDMGTVKVAA